MKQMQRCNALVIGRTGVGKSTLVAALTQTPAQGSRTDRICAKPRQVPNQSFYIYDTPGLEEQAKVNLFFSQFKRLARSLRKQEAQDNIPITALIEDFIQAQAKREPHEQIHVIWYCVGSQFAREYDLDLEWIHHLSKTSKLPVIAVITRALGQEEGWLTEQLKKQAPSIRKIVPVLAKPQTIKGKVHEVHGLENVVATTEDLLEEIFNVVVDTAIQHKVRSARIWCQDGCGKVLAANAALVAAKTVLTPLASPLIQIVKPVTTLTTPYLQGQSLKKVASIFQYEFDEDLISRLVSIGLLGMSLGICDSFMESFIEKIPGFNPDNMGTLGLVLEKLCDNLDPLTQSLSIHDTIVDFLRELGSSSIKDIPIIYCLSAISETILTAFLLIVWIEVLKKYKRADYEGRSLPDIEKIFSEETQTLLTIIAQMLRSDDALGGSPI